jgi:enamine deaminase RidA (YjgF/YER057c/UK114 family)
MENIAVVLGQRLSFDNIIKTTIFLANRRLQAVNELYGSYFNRTLQHGPRTGGRASKNAQVEIEAVAATMQTAGAIDTWNKAVISA